MPLGANKAAIMGVAGVSTDNIVLLQTQTFTDETTVSFTSGIDSTYPLYIFKFYNVHNDTDARTFQVNFSTDSGSSYAATKTSTLFRSYHNENGAAAGLGYIGYGLSQSTAVQYLNLDISSDSDHSHVGELLLFSPSNTTYVKHFQFIGNDPHYADITMNTYVGGYCNETDEVDAVQFSMVEGTFDGKIKLWGVK